MPLTKEEAARLGFKIQPIKHSMKRRAIWHDYSREGVYLITIHIAMDDERRCYNGMLLSSIVGNPMAPRDSVDYPHPVLTDVGRLVEKKIDDISSYPQFANVVIRERVIMPTHIHLIVDVLHELPYYAARKRYYHLGDMVRGFKQGCTSLFKRWLKGESVEEILTSVNGGEGCANRAGWEGKASRAYTTVPGGKSEVTLWEDKYNDHVLIGADAISKASDYVAKNAFYWKLQMDYPNLFQHRVRISVTGCDYSAYGCMFLLNRPDRRQVMCHRLAYKSMLTEEELKKWAEDANTRLQLEQYAVENRMGRFDRDWWRVNYDCKTPVPYTMTQAFKLQKESLLAACEEHDAVLVSPAISAGEKDIFYTALERGYACIKLQKAVIPKGGHPINKDRDYCGKAQLLVLGAWEIVFNDSLYTKFHNLNEMAAAMCGHLDGLTISKESLKDMVKLTSACTTP